MTLRSPAIVRLPLVGPVDLELCADEAVLPWVRGVLPVPTRAAAGPRTVRVAVTPGAPATAGEELFRQPGVSLTRGADGALVLVAAGASATVRGATADVRLAPDGPALARHALLDVLWPVLLPAVGLFHVHAAAVRDPSGAGWLLAGDANIGKSTSTLSLVQQGWDFAGDDAAYLEAAADGVVAHGWHEPVRLTARAAAALGARRRVPGTALKCDVVHTAAHAARRVSAVRLDRLLLPRLGEHTALEPIAPTGALRALILASAWIVCLPGDVQAYMRLLGRAAASRPMRLTLGPDLLERPGRLAELLSTSVELAV